MQRSEGEPDSRASSISSCAWPVGVAAVAIAAQWPAVAVGFLDGDDRTNFLDNFAFRGLGLTQLCWAWRTTLLGVYQPISWMLLILQSAIWGIDPKGYHAMSLALHGLVAALLYLVTLKLLDRADPGRASLHRPASALAAALFAAHPLRTEVVAWASCQPYLPCSIMALLATLAYLKSHDGERAPASRRAWLAGSVGLYALAILSKPAVVAFPVALLAIDTYPLRRLGTLRGAWRAILEKLPHAAVALGAAAVAMGSRRAVNGPWFPLGFRLEQASLGAWFYAIKSVWPVGLSAFYPFPNDASSPGPMYLVAAVALAISAIPVIAFARRWPAVTVGWLAYLGLLIPCSGLVPMGRAMMADRYAQLSTMALVPLLACAIVRLLANGRGKVVALVAPAAVLALAGASWDRCATWRDPEALWAEALQQARTGRLTDVRIALGAELAKRGRVVEAGRLFAEAARCEPTSSTARNNLGTILLREGDARGASKAFAEAVQLAPEMGIPRSNLGVALARLGRDDEAVSQLSEAVRLEPGSADFRAALAETLLKLGRRPEALSHLEAALRSAPNHPATKRLMASARSG